MSGIYLVTKKFTIVDETIGSFDDIEDFFTVFFIELQKIDKFPKDLTFVNYTLKLMEYKTDFKLDGRIVHSENTFNNDREVNSVTVFSSKVAYDEYVQMLIRLFGFDFEFNFETESIKMSSKFELLE